MDNRLEVRTADAEQLDASRTRKYNAEYKHGSFDEIDSVDGERTSYEALWVPRKHHEAYETAMEVATIKTSDSIHHFVRSNHAMKLRENDEVIRVGKTVVVGKDRCGLESAFAVAVRSAKHLDCISRRALPTIRLVIRRQDNSATGYTWTYIRINLGIQKIRGDLINIEKRGSNVVNMQPFLEDTQYVGVNNEKGVTLTVSNKQETFTRHVFVSRVSTSPNAFVYLVAFQHGCHFISSSSHFSRRAVMKKYPPFGTTKVAVENRLFRVHEIDGRLTIYQSAVKPAYFLATKGGTLVLRKYSLKQGQPAPDDIIFNLTHRALCFLDWPDIND